MPWTWTLRMGPVVRRESIPLSDIQYFRGSHPGHIVRVSDHEALFSAPSWLSPFDEAALVNKGRVVIKGGNAEIIYRASVGATLFLTLWFGLLIAGEIGIWFFLPSGNRALAPALAGFGLIAGVGLVVWYSVRVQVGILRGIALEAVIRLRDGESAGRRGREV